MANTEFDEGRYERSQADADHDYSPGDEQDFTPEPVPCLVCHQAPHHAPDCDLAAALRGA